MKFLALIQARMDSSRLNNKVLLTAAGKPMLQHEIERIQRSLLTDEVVVVTSIEKSNLPIVRLCADLGIRVFVGSETDVLDRYYQAARLLKAEYIIRITGDCPLFDGKLLDKAIQSLKPSTDYLGMLSETFADGLDIEIMRFEALRKAWKEARLQSQREHVTQYIIHHPEMFTLQDFQSDIGYFGDKRWTLDEPEDYIFLKTVIEHFSEIGFTDFGYFDVLEFLRTNPDLARINSCFKRNEGLAKSMAEDHIVDLTEE